MQFSWLGRTNSLPLLHIPNTKKIDVGASGETRAVPEKQIIYFWPKVEILRIVICISGYKIDYDMVITIFVIIILQSTE